MYSKCLAAFRYLLYSLSLFITVIRHERWRCRISRFLLWAPDKTSSLVYWELGKPQESCRWNIFRMMIRNSSFLPPGKDGINEAGQGLVVKCSTILVGDVHIRWLSPIFLLECQKLAFYNSGDVTLEYKKLRVIIRPHDISVVHFRRLHATVIAVIGATIPTTHVTLTWLVIRAAA